MSARIDITVSGEEEGREECFSWYAMYVLSFGNNYLLFW
jgi:hypothetical protein